MIRVNPDFAARMEFWRTTGLYESAPYPFESYKPFRFMGLMYILTKYAYAVIVCLWLSSVI